MTGSSFGKHFHVTTWGESHGKAIGVTIQGCPSGILLDESVIQEALDKRKPSDSITSTSRKEPDLANILSGVFKGKTTGTPISILIFNKDADSKSYTDIATVFRPGHGDFSYHAKYGHRDYRGGGRSSARETAARVAAGAVAQAILDRFNIIVLAYTIELGGIRALSSDLNQIASNRLLCPDNNAALKMEEKIKQVKSMGNSLGGVVEVKAFNVPPGIGEPVFDKLDADIAKGLMGIGAVKAVEIGAGINSAKMTGFENNDQITSQGFKSNNSGGILAGISNGETIIARAHVKPIPSITTPQETIDENGNETQISTRGRHDICAIPRINQVIKAMTQLVIADHILRQKTSKIEQI